MRVCIVGASGKLGQYMVRQSLDRGYEVVGVCREQSVGKLDAFKGRMSVIPGATDDREVIKRAVAGCDGVLVVMTPRGVHGYSTGTTQAVLDYAPPGARLIFSCGWHITLDGQDVYSLKLRTLVKVFGPLARLARFADLNDQVEAARRIFASDTRWTVVRGSDLEEGESQGLPVWSRHVGDPILESNITRRVDFARSWWRLSTTTNRFTRPPRTGPPDAIGARYAAYVSARSGGRASLRPKKGLAAAIEVARRPRGRHCCPWRRERRRPAAPTSSSLAEDARPRPERAAAPNVERNAPDPPPQGEGPAGRRGLPGRRKGTPPSMTQPSRVSAAWPDPSTQGEGSRSALSRPGPYLHAASSKRTSRWTRASGAHAEAVAGDLSPVLGRSSQRQVLSATLAIDDPTQLSAALSPGEGRRRGRRRADSRRRGSA